jgi:lysozyme family protein
VTADDIIDGVMEREGLYVNDPSDYGGCTNYGITFATLAAWRKTDHVTCEDVRLLTQAEARDIYRHLYIRQPGFEDAIRDDRLLALVVDFGVLSGPVTATKALQRALGVVDDGVLGAQTRRLLKAQEGSPDVYRKVLADRIRHHVEIVIRNPSQTRFLRGWLARLTGFL